MTTPADFPITVEADAQHPEFTVIRQTGEQWHEEIFVFDAEQASAIVVGLVRRYGAAICDAALTEPDAPLGGAPLGDAKPKGKKP